MKTAQALALVDLFLDILDAHGLASTEEARRIHNKDLLVSALQGESLGHRPLKVTVHDVRVGTDAVRNLIHALEWHDCDDLDVSSYDISQAEDLLDQLERWCDEE